MTLGTLKFRLTKSFPGVDADLIEGWIADRYAEILAVLPWSRQQAQAVLQTTAPYETGTVAVTNASASVTLTTGVWTADMSGRAFRVGTEDAFYELTFVTSTTGTLDRAYEGSTNTAATYSITQAVYALPSDCRLLDADAFSSFELGPLTRFSRAELNQSQPWRSEIGTPTIFSPYMDDASTPPRMQVELYPIPDAVMSLPFSYTAEGDALTATATIVKAWIQPAALLEGVTAKIKRHLKDYAGAREHDTQAAAALALMLRAEAHGSPNMRMTLDSFYTSYRAARGNR